MAEEFVAERTNRSRIELAAGARRPMGVVMPLYTPKPDVLSGAAKAPQISTFGRA